MNEINMFTGGTYRADTVRSAAMARLSRRRGRIRLDWAGSNWAKNEKSLPSQGLGRLFY
jgi:hypothetical protein